MPLYDIQCDGCGHTTEIFRSLDKFDQPLPFHCFHEMRRLISAPRVMSDIAEYRAVAADKETGKLPVIGSRSHHREFLKRNNYVELGNEMPKVRAPIEPNRHEIGRQIKRVMDQKGIRA
jgi:putative FmdB family regulatory protein